ncbi:SoxR reducing system RseC family protein [Candidatus Latescibacterota bacterium]
MKERCEGKVISTDGTKARIKVATVAECAGCASKSHCHTGGNTSRELTVINECGAKVDDDIIFEVTPVKFILSAVLIWILPLLSMVVGYMVAERFASGIWPIAAAFAFLVVAFGFLKIIDNTISGGKTFYPVITKIVHSSGKK